MGWFTWFSTSKVEDTTPTGTAPLRSDREKCWMTRDGYFDCLDNTGVLVPGKEEGKCQQQKLDYEHNCAKSWVSISSYICYEFLKFGYSRLSTLIKSAL
jgi:cytochrome c oxidase assembly factor 6